MESFIAGIWSTNKSAVSNEQLLASQNPNADCHFFLTQLFRYSIQCVERLNDQNFAGQVLNTFNRFTANWSKDDKVRTLIACAKDGDVQKRARFSWGLAFVGKSRSPRVFSEATLALLFWFYTNIDGVFTSGTGHNQTQNSYASAVGVAHSSRSQANHAVQAHVPPPSYAQSAPSSSEAYFFPSERSFQSLVNFLSSAKSSLDICVFNITDNDIARAITAARARGVAVRIISDDEQLKNQGSDVVQLAQEGVPVKVDSDPVALVHHKFAIVDGTSVLTGSYNWTKAARNTNRENIVIVRDAKVAQEFSAEFNRMWKDFRSL